MLFNILVIFLVLYVASFAFFMLGRLAKDLYFLQNAEGSGLAPFDCWICARGIKTMVLRVEKQQVLCFPEIIFYCKHSSSVLFSWYKILGKKKYPSELYSILAYSMSSDDLVKKMSSDEMNIYYIPL